ncbi:MAG: T9SS type A sorting domain-containing protein, partial [Flavobacteriales bacterium]|nr:T9SS type A sorting domain-containing protein [Flavobacteriales bacterium]
TIQGPFSSNTRIRFRCDASTNSDYIYIDDVTITGCSNAARLDGETEDDTQLVAQTEELFSEVNLYPNPANEAVNLAFNLAKETSFTLMITDIQGRVIQNQSMTRPEGNQLIKIPTADLESGTYLVHMISPDGKSSKRFVIFR